MTPSTNPVVRPLPRGKRLDHRHMLEDRRVHEWHDETSLRSRLSADSNVRKLGLLCYRLGVSPADLVNLAKSNPDRLHSMLLAFAKQLTEKEGRLSVYVIKLLDGLRAWVVFNGAPAPRLPKLDSVSGESLSDEKVPTREEFRNIANVLGVRGRLVWYLMGHSGVRPGSLHSLQLKDIPELVLRPKVVIGVPSGASSFRIYVPAKASKNRIPYLTFSPLRSTGDALLVYLHQRLAAGEDLGPESPLLTTTAMGTRSGVRKMGDPISVTKITQELREGIRKTRPAGRLRPYVARSFYFEALSEARVDRDAREVLGGHFRKGNVTVAHYSYGSRRQMRDQDVSFLRSEYEKALEALGVERDQNGRTEILTKALGGLLKARGVDAERVTAILEGRLSDEELSDLLKGSESSEVPVEPAKRTGEQRVIAVDELQRYLDGGWAFKTAVNGSKTLVTWNGLIQ
jgi:integrase